MDEERVSIAAHSNSECLARSHRYDVNLNTGRSMKDGQDVAKQAAVLS
jgi:hypothetical protein